MRVLGVDLGLKRTGLAVSDALGISVRLLPNLLPKSRQEDMAALLGICHQLELSDIVIGVARMPRTGDLGFMGKRALGFGEALTQLIHANKLDIRVHLVDESYSSVMANQRMAELGVSPKKRKERLDGEVARMLVEEFLATQSTEARSR